MRGSILPAATAASKIEYSLDLEAIVCQDIGQGRGVFAYHFTKQFVLLIYKEYSNGINSIDDNLPRRSNSSLSGGKRYTPE